VKRSPDVRHIQNRTWKIKWFWHSRASFTCVFHLKISSFFFLNELSPFIPIFVLHIYFIYIYIVMTFNAPCVLVGSHFSETKDYVDKARKFLNQKGYHLEKKSLTILGPIINFKIYSKISTSLWPLLNNVTSKILLTLTTKIKNHRWKNQEFTKLQCKKVNIGQSEI